jgi:Reverse transcriptase (RNA-dependent DNA polymerase)
LVVKIEFKRNYNNSTFNDEGPLKFLPGYKNIHVDFFFAVKHDLSHKACLVAGGHLNDPNTTNSKYSSAVSLRSMQIAITAGELKNLCIMVGDISSAYLEAFTLEKVYFIAGTEFGPLPGHLLTIVRAFYGLHTFGASWYDHFSDVMHQTGFSPCKGDAADPDVWIHGCIVHYEYVLDFVDDIMFIAKEPQQFFDSLVNEWFQIERCHPHTTLVVIFIVILTVPSHGELICTFPKC